MAYYLLKVERPGARSYKEAGMAKHMIDASSLDNAKAQADEIVDEHYAGGGAATMRLLDETGLVATRKGEAEWDA